jgi:8-oxo-dGTP diphosphatase
MLLIRIAVAVVERDGEFLVGVRAAGTHLAGMCEFPGGKIEPDETPEAAALRECLEETGIEVQAKFAYPTVSHEYEARPFEIHFFGCTPLDAAAPPLPPFRWIPRAKLAECNFPPANDALMTRLLQG